MPSSLTPPVSPSVFDNTQAAAAWSKFHAYEKVRLLGRGQHGAAVLLRSPDGGDVVVAKQVATEGLGPSELEKVESEVRILQRFSHANVVSYFCCFLHEETLSIVMEYCDGGTLAEAISAHAERSEHFATALVATWAKQLGGAVQHVHAHRVLHRDIKTANVFLTAQRQIKLGDFGISRVMGTHTNLAETVCGTPYYLSPELVMGQPYNQPADAWAIGVILYELLTLKRPFTGPNIAALVLKITRCEYDRATLGASPHPPELRALSDALLVADPAKRLTLDVLLATPVVAAAADDATERRERSRRRIGAVTGGGASPPTPPPVEASAAGGSRRRAERRERRAAVVVQAAARRWLACAEARRRRAQLQAEITWAVDITAVGTIAAAVPLAAARARFPLVAPAAPPAAPAAPAGRPAFAVTRTALDIPSRRRTASGASPLAKGGKSPPLPSTPSTPVSRTATPPSASSSVGSTSRPASRPRSAELLGSSVSDDEPLSVAVPRRAVASPVASPLSASLARTRHSRQPVTPPAAEGGGGAAKLMPVMPIPLPEPPGGWPVAVAGGGGERGGQARPPRLTFSIEQQQQPALFKRDLSTDDSLSAGRAAAAPSAGPISPPKDAAAAAPFAFTIDHDGDSPTKFFQRRSD